MRIFVTAKPRAREQSVQRIDQTHYCVSVREPPIQGKANAAIIAALAGYLHVSSSLIRLVSGYTSKQKVFEIPRQVS